MALKQDDSVTAAVKATEVMVGGTALDSPSEREIARQERMKREG